MVKKLSIRDLTLRDGQQSQLATRMTQEQIDRILPFYKDANFFALEVWGGAVPDATMRYLNENPWERLLKIKKSIGDVSKLTALSRGRNLFGYNPYPESVIEGFNRNAIETGIDIMRIFDALNDTDNMKSTIEVVKKNGGIADCAVCYTVDPKFSVVDHLKAFLTSNKIPPAVFNLDYFVNKALILEKLGAGIITIKDMAGLIDPDFSGKLIKKLKEKIKIPIDLHTHCTPGNGLASILMGIVSGVDIVDTVIWNFSGGPAAPAVEFIQIIADKLGIATDINHEAISKINKKLLIIRNELAAFDKTKKIPKQFDFYKDELPTEISKLFDQAIEKAHKNQIKELLDTCHLIEKYFGFPPPNIKVRDAEIPGGMYTNMIAQLETMKVPHLFEKVLTTIPIVRLNAGMTPLVTPTSQIVGAQAVNCVISESKGRPFYGQTTKQFVNLVKGSYGKTPIPIDPKFREKICNVKEEVPYDTSNYQKQDNPVIDELGDVRLAENEKEELLLELFPDVAKKFLKENKITKRMQEEEDAIHNQYAKIMNGLRDNYQA